jgi:hypothetical protein
MDWPMLRQNGSTYRGFYYMFDNAGDNTYGPDSQEILSRSERRDYLSQWNGDNNMYYNPATYYFSWASSTHTWDPSSTNVWPSMPDADLDYPRSNPITTQTLDFRSTSDVLAASDELIPYMTLWQGGGQRVEVARVVGSTGSRTLADAVRLVHEDAPARIRVSGGNDDAEQKSDGTVYLPSTDLDMICDGYDNGAIGIRFAGVIMPYDWDPATNPITEAHIIFIADHSDSSAVNLSLTGELSDNSSAFTTGNANITNRAETGTSVSWNNVPAWTAGNEYQTPDIHQLVNSIASQAGWANGNAMTFIVRETSGGCRRAVAFNRDPSRAPLLVLKTANSDENAPDIIVDNNDDLFQWEGTSSWSGWWSRTNNTAYDHRFFRTYRGEQSGDKDHRATWLLNMNTAGLYHVYAWVPDRGADIDSQAPYTIYFNGGNNSATVIMDQRSQNDGGNAAQWHELLMTTTAPSGGSSGATTLTVVDTGFVPDTSAHGYTFTIDGDPTEYTLTAGTTATDLHFTPGLATDVAVDTVITFREP